MPATIAETLIAVTCPVCGRRWRRWCSSRGITHAICAVPEGLQDEALLVFESFRPQLSMKRLAADLRMSVFVLRACLERARRRRAERA
jgi:hypothetical protein